MPFKYWRCKNICATIITRHIDLLIGKAKAMASKKMSISALLNATRLGKEKEISEALEKFGLPANAKRTTDYTVLQTAVKKNHENIVKLLVNAGCRVNANSDDSGLTPLACAIKNENEKIAEFLLDNEADFVVNDSNGITVFHMAAQQKSLKMLKLLFEYDVDVDSLKTVFEMFFESSYPYTQLDDENAVEIFKLFLAEGVPIDIPHDSTVLHFVATTKHKDLIISVLKATADVNKCNEEGNTSLHHLMKNSTLNETDISKILQQYILRGAKIDIPNNKRKTVCHLAVKKKYTLILQILLQCLLDNYCNTQDNKLEDFAKSLELLEMLAANGIALESKFNEGLNIFHLAAMNKDTELLSKLLPYCVDANVRDLYENTVLHLMLSSYVNSDEKEEKELLELISTLISKGASVESVNIKGHTPLHLALQNKHFDIVDILLQHGADITALDNNGNSTLHYMSMSKSESKGNKELEFIKMYLSLNQNCDLNIKNKDGITPLMFAAKSGCACITRILLQCGAKPDCTVDEDLSTPLHIAAGYNHVDVVKELIKFDIDVNLKKIDGKTALHISAAHKDSSVTKILLENGADTDLKDESGMTPLHYACLVDSIENITDLLNDGADVNAEENGGGTPLMLNIKNTDSWTVLYYHVLKLKAANMFVSDQTEMCIAEYEKNNQDSSLVLSAGAFIHMANEELMKMSRIKINEIFTLFDLLKMTPRQFHYFNNHGIQEFLFSEDFHVNFPLYGNLIKSNHGKNIERNGLSTLAVDALKHITKTSHGVTLDDHSNDKIVENLNNEDIRKLIKAANVEKTNKRKRSVEDENVEDTVVSPMKRSREDNF